MNKLEQLHFDDHDYRDAAEITKQVAIEFAEWILDYDPTLLYQKTKEELFQEFLNSKK